MSPVHPLGGSERVPLAGARDLGPCRSDERFEVTLTIRSRTPGGGGEAARRALAAGRAHDSAGFARDFGADPGDLALVAAFATHHGLVVVEESAVRRAVVLAGTASRFGAAFGVDLRTYGHPDGTHRGYAGSVRLPPELSGVVLAVLGLDDRPQAAPRFRRREGDGAARHPRQAGAVSYAAPEVAALYGFPQADGTGQCIGLIELGGGYRTADLDTYFADLGISAAPRVTSVSVDQAQNAPTGDPNGADAEVALDIEVAGAIAPGARIAVYFAPNTDRGFVDAVTTATHDAENHPTVLSISWGGPESTWTGQALAALDDALAAAAALGISVFVAAGDSGSSDGVADGQPHVDFPASSPHVTACGGTRLVAAQGVIEAETVWNDGAYGGATGGGVSEVFSLPPWQQAAGVPAAPDGRVGRGVPDVAGDADPYTGYRVLVDGAASVVGGTSAVAPLWAALLARINQLRGTAPGLINPALYGHAQDLHEITQGNNGAYRAGPGWNPCTGLGSPDGTALEKVL